MRRIIILAGVVVLGSAAYGQPTATPTNTPVLRCATWTPVMRCATWTPAITATPTETPIPIYNRMSGWTNHPMTNTLAIGDVLQSLQNGDEATWGRFQARDSGVGAPPASDCDDSTEFGYMYLDYDTSPRRLYLCLETGSGEGWDYTGLTD